MEWVADVMADLHRCHILECEGCREDIAKLIAGLEVAEKALEFYSRRENYFPDSEPVGDGTYGRQMIDPAVFRDMGGHATQALAQLHSGEFGAKETESLGPKTPWKGKYPTKPLQTVKTRWNEWVEVTNWNEKHRYAVSVWDDGTITHEKLSGEFPVTSDE